jgi:hypothetical protein
VAVSAPSPGQLKRLGLTDGDLVSSRAFNTRVSVPRRGADDPPPAEEEQAVERDPFTGQPVAAKDGAAAGGGAAAGAEGSAAGGGVKFMDAIDAGAETADARSTIKRQAQRQADSYRRNQPRAGGGGPEPSAGAAKGSGGGGGGEAGGKKDKHLRKIAGPPRHTY